jgi:3-oxosteroid 1-dehydrogenase
MEIQCDVVVIGSGVGGLASALSAHESGLKVIVVEKGEKLGGGTGVSAGGIWIGNNHLAQEAGVTDSRDDIISYMKFLGGAQIDEEKLLAYVDVAPEALQFYEQCGVEFKLIKNIPDHYFPDGPGSRDWGRTIEAKLISANELGDLRDNIFMSPNEPPEVTSEESIGWGGFNNLAGWDMELVEKRRSERMLGRGAALVAHLVKALLAREVPIYRGMAADKLRMDGDRVIGITTENGDIIHAGKSVVISTGGYESNDDLAATYEGLPGWRSMFPDTLTGDGMIMATEIGAAVEIIHNNMALFLGFVVPRKKEDSIPFFRLVGITEMLCPHTLVVNGQGQRFADESYFQSIIPALREFSTSRHTFVNLPCYLVFDSQFKRKFSFVGNSVGDDIPSWVASADNFKDLAGKLDVDPEGLMNTVSRFNGFAESGYDEDFLRGDKKWSLGNREAWNEGDGKSSYANPTLGSLSEPPYYAVELHPSAFCSAGLLTNAQAQVINQRGNPILGLYAVGNAAAHTEYGVGYQAGYSLASGLTFGYVAAKHMTENK